MASPFFLNRNEKGIRRCLRCRSHTNRSPEPAAEVETQSGESSRDTIYRAVAANGEAVVLTMTATALVSEAVRRHKTAPTASAALGRCLIGTALLSAFKKDEEQVMVSVAHLHNAIRQREGIVGLNVFNYNCDGNSKVFKQVVFQCRGSLGTMRCMGNSSGLVRGYVQNPSANAPLRSDGKLNVSGIVGNGVLSVVRSHPSWKEPYNGLVLIQTGEIAEDIAHYLAESEQINSAIALGVLMNREGEVSAAGGYFVQVLPHASEESLTALERNISEMPNPSELASSDLSAADIANSLLDGLGGVGTETEIHPLYGPCSIPILKERMFRAVASIPRNELAEMLEEDEGVEVTCEFCNESVRFEPEEFASILEE